MVSQMMESELIWPENTRLSKNKAQADSPLYNILQASTTSNSHIIEMALPPPSEERMRVCIRHGDHKDELIRICGELRCATRYVANETQRCTLELYIESFESGDLGLYRDALKLWVRDLMPKVEHIIGFVEPYRDPYGVRAEFEGLVGIADPEEARTLAKLADSSDAFIKELPWCDGQEGNNGKGPFEKSLFEPPDFSSIHGKHNSAPLVNCVPHSRTISDR